MSSNANSFIDTETFYLSPDISATSSSPTDPALNLIPASTLSKLKNLGPARLRDMRSQNTSMQIVSHLPIDASPKQCQKINDALASSIVMNQDRFAGLALLPCWDAKSAAEELGRCVSKYRFVGGVLGFRAGDWTGKGFDEEVGGIGRGFEELWKAAERYRVPVVLRPVFPNKDQVSG
jgi:predicted TIM-barrel fold metal-dependent hydrolase